MGTNSPQMLSVPLFSWEKDLDSVYTDANEEAAKLAGFAKSDQLIGKTDYELPCPASEGAESFRKEDRHVMSKQCDLKTLQIYDYGAGLFLLLVKKVPLYKNARLLGTYACAVNITQLFSEVNQVLLGDAPPCYNLVKGSYYVGYNNLDVKLSLRQQECLFFLLRGKTAKQTGRQLNLGHRTVENYLETIKNKFNCQNKYELIERATELGFLNRIPEQLLYQSLMPLTRNHK